MRKNSRFLPYKPRKINLNLCRINLILYLQVMSLITKSFKIVRLSLVVISIQHVR